MTLTVDGDVAGAPLSVEVPAGAWTVATHPDPDAAAAVVAGTAPAGVSVALDGRLLRRRDAAGRQRAGLAVATSRLGCLPSLRVVDVVMLGLDGPQPPLWQIVLGTRRARTVQLDDEAAARALAGRLGLASRLDAAAVGLPAATEALLDLARALASGPRALVWRRPEWLPPADAEEIAAVAAGEHARSRLTVLELRASPERSAGP